MTNGICLKSSRSNKVTGALLTASDNVSLLNSFTIECSCIAISEIALLSSVFPRTEITLAFGIPNLVLGLICSASTISPSTLPFMAFGGIVQIVFNRLLKASSVPPDEETRNSPTIFDKLFFFGILLINFAS